MTVSHPPALTVAALRDILAAAEDTAVIWINAGGNQLRVLTDEFFVVPEEDPEFACDIVIGSRVEAWYDVVAERGAK